MTVSLEGIMNSVECKSPSPLVPFVTEVAQTSVSPSVIGVKTDGREPSGLLKNFQDIMRKQRPEGVSHLLQDNLPKCKSCWYLLT